MTHSIRGENNSYFTVLTSCGYQNLSSSYRITKVACNSLKFIAATFLYPPQCMARCVIRMTVIATFPIVWTLKKLAGAIFGQKKKEGSSKDTQSSSTSEMPTATHLKAFEKVDAETQTLDPKKSEDSFTQTDCSFRCDVGIQATEDKVVVNVETQKAQSQRAVEVQTEELCKKQADGFTETDHSLMCDASVQANEPRQGVNIQTQTEKEGDKLPPPAPARPAPASRIEPRPMPTLAIDDEDILRRLQAMVPPEPKKPSRKFTFPDLGLHSKMGKMGNALRQALRIIGAEMLRLIEAPLVNPSSTELEPLQVEAPEDIHSDAGSVQEFDDEPLSIIGEDDQQAPSEIEEQDNAEDDGFQPDLPPIDPGEDEPDLPVVEDEGDAEIPPQPVPALPRRRGHGIRASELRDLLQRNAAFTQGIGAQRNRRPPQRFIP